MHVATKALPLAVAIALCACDADGGGERVFEATLSDGTYRVAFGQGFTADVESRLLSVTAQLDRASGHLDLTLPAGSHAVLAFAPRPRAQWQPDCFTMSSHALDEVADLSPRPLQIESVTFVTPMVYAKCGPRRMILADAYEDGTDPGLAFDLQ